MAILGLVSVTLEVPELEQGVRFYSDAGLISNVTDDQAKFRCDGQSTDCLILQRSSTAKRLHHVTFRADELGEIAKRVLLFGGYVVEFPPTVSTGGLWVRDPHGMLFELVDIADEPPLPAGPAFEINQPGHTVRKGRSGVLPLCRYPAIRPMRLGHVLVFSPDVLKSTEFVTQALGMGLADRSEDVIAFCCARQRSDHHVLAFAKSPGVGFHHASFQVNDPDDVGRGGLALLGKTGKGDWGFGRHTIGSNYFHYVQDPWGSWFEYYCDMDYIEDYARWTPTNYKLEDSLANWGPKLPPDFVHNYELGGNGPGHSPGR